MTHVSLCLLSPISKPSSSTRGPLIHPPHTNPREPTTAHHTTESTHSPLPPFPPPTRSRLSPLQGGLPVDPLALLRPAASLEASCEPAANGTEGREEGRRRVGEGGRGRDREAREGRTGEKGGKGGREKIGREGRAGGRERGEDRGWQAQLRRHLGASAAVTREGRGRLHRLFCAVICTREEPRQVDDKRGGGRGVEIKGYEGREQEWRT